MRVPFWSDAFHFSVNVSGAALAVPFSDIVFFNEELDEKLLEQAFHDFETSDIALVIGSSLSVPPVCTLPMAARLNHGKIIIVNEQPTQYDQYATYKFNDIADFCQNIQDYFF